MRRAPADEETVLASVDNGLGLVRYLVVIMPCWPRVLCVCGRMIGCSLAQDQDMLLEFYLQQLAKRLLLNKSVGLHVEEEVISRMKSVFGLQFVAKIVSLVTNYRIAAADELGKLDDCDGTQLDVMTLKASSWPSFPLFADVIPPPAMAACMARFTMVYGAKNPMHKASWWA